MLLIENSGQQRQTGAAVESFRNEMVKANDASRELLLATIQSQNPNIQYKPSDKFIDIGDSNVDN